MNYKIKIKLLNVHKCIWCFINYQNKKDRNKKNFFPQTGTNVQKLNDECEDYLLNVRIMIEIKIILIYQMIQKHYAVNISF